VANRQRLFSSACVSAQSIVIKTGYKDGYFGNLCCQIQFKLQCHSSPSMIATPSAIGCSYAFPGLTKVLAAHCFPPQNPPHPFLVIPANPPSNSGRRTESCGMLATRCGVRNAAVGCHVSSPERTAQFYASACFCTTRGSELGTGFHKPFITAPSGASHRLSPEVGTARFQSLAAMGMMNTRCSRRESAWPHDQRGLQWTAPR